MPMIEAIPAIEEIPQVSIEVPVEAAQVEIEARHLEVAQGCDVQSLGSGILAADFPIRPRQAFELGLDFAAQLPHA